MARRKIDRFIESCPYLTEETKKKLSELYSDETKLDDIVAIWIKRSIDDMIASWWQKEYDNYVTIP